MDPSDINLSVTMSIDDDPSDDEELWTLEKKFISAVISRDERELSECLNHGVDPNIFIYPGRKTTALHCFAERGDVSLGVLMLKCKETKVNAHDDEFYAPIHLAAIFRKKKFVYLLCKHTLEVDVRTRNGRTALMFAVKFGALDIVAILLKNGAEVNATDCFGCCALSVAANETKNGEMVQLLLDNGADPWLKVGSVLPIYLELILQCHSVEEIDIVRVFIDSDNFDPTTEDAATKKHSLHIVALTGYIPLARELLRTNQKVDTPDLTGRTPLNIAIKGHHKHMIRLLRSHSEYYRVLTTRRESWPIFSVEPDEQYYFGEDYSIF